MAQKQLWVGVDVLKSPQTLVAVDMQSVKAN